MVKGDFWILVVVCMVRLEEEFRIFGGWGVGIEIFVWSRVIKVVLLGEGVVGLGK